MQILEILVKILLINASRLELYVEKRSNFEINSKVFVLYFKVFWRLVEIRLKSKLRDINVIRYFQLCSYKWKQINYSKMHFTSSGQWCSRITERLVCASNTFVHVKCTINIYIMSTYLIKKLSNKWCLSHSN